MSRYFFRGMFFMLAMIILGCGGDMSVDDTSVDDISSEVVDQTVDESDLLPFALSEGQPDDVEDVRPPLAATSALSQEQLQTLLSHLPALQVEEGDVQEYRLPAQSLPPPRPGQEVTLPFPQPQVVAAPEVETTPLEVLRFSPEGAVPLAPQLSVTFNQPMVPLSSHGELAQEDIPLRLWPDVRGNWRWVGTKTLFFEAHIDGIDRMPMATQYTAEIPAGTAAVNGQELAETVNWTFRTPAVTLQRGYPSGGPLGLEPVFFSSFDQRIDPVAVIPQIQVTARGRTYPVRLASADEIATDATLQRLVEGGQESRWLAFVADEPFPKDATVTVTFAEGTPSAEGPLVTEQPQSYSFQTYGPFMLRQAACTWDGGRECYPFAPWSLTFSNPIDSASFDATRISIEPQLEGAQFDIFGNTLQIRGNTQGRTTYKVTVAAGLADVFGQTLAEDVEAHFRIRPMETYLTANSGPLTVLDPYGEPTFPIYTVNINAVTVRAYRVEPEQYVEYLQWDPYYDEDPPGTLVLERVVDISGPNDMMIETSINLADALAGSSGHLILEVQPAAALFSEFFNGQRHMNVVSWIQVTQIGLDAFVDSDEMLVWANRLQDGAPLPGLQVSLWPQDIAGITDETGTVRLSLPAKDAQLLIARDGDDVVFLPEDQYYSAWKSQPAKVAARFYVFDDRQMYRPGETVSLKGWMRQIQPGPEGDVGLFSERAADRILDYRVSDSLGNTITRGETSLNALGGFDFRFDLPLNVNLGFIRIELLPLIFDLYDRDNRPRHVHTIQVQEFRRPEFEVSAAVSEGPHLVGGHALATVSANYFAGGPLPGAEVEWYVNAKSGSYSPPNWSGFTFGKWIPWWSFYDEYDTADYDEYDTAGLGSASFTSRTDSAGQHTLRIDLRANDSRYPLHMETNATVFDVNRQAWTSQASLLVHAADLYIGLRSARYFVEKGEPLAIDLVVTDIDGKAIEGHRASLRAARLDWQYRNDEWQEVEKDVQECLVETTSASDPYAGEFATCTFETTRGGKYRITATVIDSQGRTNETQLVRWVSGGQHPPSRSVEQEEIQLIPDRESYQPGDSAEILVQAAFFPAEGIVTLRREGLISSERFSMEGPTHTLRLPIEDNYIPNLHVQVDLVGAAPRVDVAGNELLSLPRRPAYARGTLNLSIPPLRRILQVEATPQEDHLQPGAETTIDVTVRDANGEPVADAEFALVVVDEAILALTAYQLVDPIDIFYSGRADAVNEYHNRAHVLLADPELLTVPKETSQSSLELHSPEMARVQSAPMAMEEAAMDMDSAEAGVSGGGGEGQAIRVRLNFDPLALFAPAVRTDAQGQASVSVTVPDNLTRYRVMLVAVAGGKFFGFAESSLTARLPLMVRPSAPRFLNFGDTFELPVVLQNQTDEPMEVYVAVQATNIAASQVPVAASKASLATGYALTVPAADRVEVRFPARTVRAGSARFQFMATDVKRSAIADAATIELPVFTPATTEAFAVYGELDTNTAILQAVRPPDEVIPSYGGLEVTMSSTALQTLTDAFLYLLRYPYECSEQIASRILGVAALRDVLTAFDAEALPDPEEIERSMEQDIQALQAMQHYSGGFPIWRRGDRVWPYYSVHAAHALARAQQKGYQVPEGMISRSLAYLRNIQKYIPEWYDVQTRRALVSYALYVRKLLHDHDPTQARRLIMEAGLGNLSLESIGWLLFVLTDDPASEGMLQEIRRFLQNRVTETAGAATISSGYSDGEYLLLYSNRRADAVLLEALMVDQPQSDLITKMVRGLLGHRTKGRWGNTQENVWVLLAMERFFNTFEAQTPDFMARIWLGEQYVAGHQFQGRSVQNVTLDLPMQFVQDRPTDDDGIVPLIVQKEGAGRLYYRLGLRYAPTDLRLAALDSGFAVERVYEAVDDPEDVSRDEKGTWYIRAGARVRVKLTMVAPARRVHVALVDPLPAGLEILNPALAVSGDLPEDPSVSPRQFGRYWWWKRTWYEHQNLRDARAEAFSSFLGAGVYQYSYTARATTPGTFVVPPAKAEEMYAPETFGRSGTDWVVVDAREE